MLIIALCLKICVGQARPCELRYQTMATKRQYLSGAAKRKAKKQRKSEVKGKRTLEEFGWKAIARAVDCEEDDEISLDTGCRLVAIMFCLLHTVHSKN